MPYYLIIASCASTEDASTCLDLFNYRLFLSRFLDELLMGIIGSVSFIDGSARVGGVLEVLHEWCFLG